MGRAWFEEYPEISIEFENLTIIDKIKLTANFRRIENDYIKNPNFGFDWMRKSYLPIDEGGRSICSKGINKLKKIYTPCMKVDEFEKGKLVKLDSKNYYVPWFCGFAKDEEGKESKSYRLNLEFDDSSKTKLNGKIYTESKNRNIEITFEETSLNYFTLSNELVSNKIVNIKFIDYIKSDTIIEVFYMENGSENKEILGFLNINKNNIEYTLKAKYLSIDLQNKILYGKDKLNPKEGNILRFHKYYTDKYSEKVKLWSEKSKQILSQSLIRYKNDNKIVSIKFKKKFRAYYKPEFGYMLVSPHSKIINKDKLLKSIESDVESKINETLIFLFPFNIVEMYAIYSNEHKKFKTYDVLNRELIDSKKLPDVSIKPLEATTPENINPSNKSVLMTPSTFLEENHIITHEILHTTGLFHSFEKEKDIEFIQGLTDNIMDYPYLSQNDRKQFSTEEIITKKTSISKKQWEHIHKGLDVNITKIDKK